MSSTNNSAKPDDLIDAGAGMVYWENISADVDGMLGGIPTLKGFGSISKIDLQGSRTFLARLGIGAKRGRNLLPRAVDGGAGYVISLTKLRVALTCF